MISGLIQAVTCSPVIANDQYDFYVYDSTNDAAVNYDQVLIVPNANGKDGSKAVADLMEKEWADVKVVLANPAGKTGGFYVKAMLLPPIYRSSACSSAQLRARLPPAMDVAMLGL